MSKAALAETMVGWSCRVRTSYESLLHVKLAHNWRGLPAPKLANAQVRHREKRAATKERRAAEKRDKVKLAGLIAGSPPHWRHPIRSRRTS